MGMFDYIRCEVPLPDGWKPYDLQTKDFDCQMVTHVITKDGRLMLERIDRCEEVPRAERPYPNDDGILGLMGSIRNYKSLHDSKFHGVVNFYGSEYQTPDGQPASYKGVEHDADGVRCHTTKAPLKHVWHEYNAKFTDGQLVSIEVVLDDA
jgi:hypothetical protein